MSRKQTGGACPGGVGEGRGRCLTVPGTTGARSCRTGGSFGRRESSCTIGWRPAFLFGSGMTCWEGVPECLCAPRRDKLEAIALSPPVKRPPSRWTGSTLNRRPLTWQCGGGDGDRADARSTDEHAFIGFLRHSCHLSVRHLTRSAQMATLAAEAPGDWADIRGCIISA